jgi:crotonobetainyl-CoA:carnitine CoA-transferase CaiB-like acyl-CoA transferase
MSIRDKRDEGQVVDVKLYESDILMEQCFRSIHEGSIGKRKRSIFLARLNNLYPTADGKYLAIAR